MCGIVDIAEECELIFLILLHHQSYNLRLNAQKKDFVEELYDRKFYQMCLFTIV
jgi:hypothetical protein